MDIIKYDHGIITEIALEKISYYVHNSVYRWRIAENARIFWSHAKQFGNLQRVRNTESSLDYANKSSSISKLYSLLRKSGGCTQNFDFLS